MERCIALGHQLADLVKDGFLKQYLEDSQEGPQGEVVLMEPAHETPIHGKLNTIPGPSISVWSARFWAQRASHELGPVSLVSPVENN